MEKLTDTLEYVFRGIGGRYYNYSSANPIGNACMTIPMKNTIIELPVLMLYELPKMPFIPDAFVANLNYIGLADLYKTLSSNVKAALTARFSGKRLFKITLSDKSSNVYYGTFGAIFDENFHPIMMLSWKMYKIPIDKDIPDKVILRPVNPILRIHPSVFINKNDSMKRFIANKIFPTALELAIHAPYAQLPYLTFTSYNRLYSVQVIVDKMPFEVKEPSLPSISTTNKSLINVALDNLDEIIIA